MIYKREEFFEENPGNERFPVKTIEQVTAVDGSETRFIGRVSLGISTPMGMSTLPVSFEIDAPSIREAFAKFEQIAEGEIDKAKSELQEQLQEVRRQAQNRIVTPGEMGGLNLPGGQGPGAPGGPGGQVSGPKIQL
jgi:hypothetical protein